MRQAIVICEPWLGSNGYAALKAFRRVGWSVRALHESEFIPLKWRSIPMRLLGRALRRAAVREFNEALLRYVRADRPELVLVFKGMFTTAGCLGQIRREGVKAYCFYPDVSFRTHGPYLPKSLREYDWIFTTKEFGLSDMASQLGVRDASVLLHAYDADLHRPAVLGEEERRRFSCDVSFIGTWSPKKEALLTGLVQRRQNIHVRVWGEQWSRVPKASSLRPSIVGRAVVGEDYICAIAGSKINLGILSERRHGASADDQITSRTFHIPAAGGFMLHERTAAVTQIFEEGKSIACYDGVDELVTAVDTYLSDPCARQEIALRGRAAVVGAHSWDQRIREILALHQARSV